MSPANIGRSTRPGATLTATAGSTCSFQAGMDLAGCITTRPMARFKKSPSIKELPALPDITHRRVSSGISTTTAGSIFWSATAIPRSPTESRNNWDTPLVATATRGCIETPAPGVSRT